MGLPQNYAVIRTATGTAALQPAPLPTVADDYLLIRPVAVALNPTDWTTLDAPGDTGSIVGCDYAGVVEKVGSAATRGWKVGDRVAGFAHGGNDANYQHGAFARYIVAKADIQFHIPEHISFETACTVGVGLGTQGYALYKVLGLPWPGAAPDAQQQGDRIILIYGGSTATGTLAIQFAKMSGFTVHTTASPKNFDLVKQRGADAVYDYRDPNVGAQIRAATKNALTLVFDCVSTAPTARIAGEALTSAPSAGARPKYVSLLGPPCPRDDVDSTFFLVYSASGEAYRFEGEDYPADPAFFEFAVQLAQVVEKLWADRAFVEHPQREQKGGLRGIVEEGLQTMRTGAYSGEKLVYLVDETRWE